MRIGIFTNNFKPIISGVAVSVANFKEGLEKLGHQVYVFAPRFRDHTDKDKNIFRYPAAPIRYKAKYPIPLPTLKDDDFLKLNKLDLIHSQHPWGVGSYGLKLAKHFKLPLVFTNHTMYSQYVDYLPKILPRKILMKLVERSAIKYANRADAVVAPTEMIKNYLIQNGVKAEIFVVPSGVEHAILSTAPPANLRERYKIPEDHKILINVSRIGPEKNLPTILKAYQLILKQFDKVTLVMVGGGPYLETLKDLARDLEIDGRVVFTGLVSLEERGGYFREGDIFVHSSLSETQGLVMVDSMALGVPVVAIKANGVVDVVQNGVSGLIVDEGIEPLAQGVLKVLRDETLREKLSKGARESSQKYTIENTSKMLEGVYKRVLERKGPNFS